MEKKRSKAALQSKSSDDQADNTTGERDHLVAKGESSSGTRGLGGVSAARSRFAGGFYASCQ